MTQIEWQHLEATVAGMTDEEKQKLADLLTPVSSDESPSPSNPSLGLFADDPQVIGGFQVGNPVVEEPDAVRLAKAIQFLEPDRPLTQPVSEVP